MMIKAGDLVNFGRCQFHFTGQRDQVGCREVAKFILNLMQMFDQQVFGARLVAE